jgi:nitrile hydratase subunit beta
MNGIHDMGGMQGLGPIAPEQDEPVFHARWEGRMLALSFATGAWRRWPVDASRQQMESMQAADYLRVGYYEKWLYSLTENGIRQGLFTREEVETGLADPHAPKATPPLTAARVDAVMSAGGPKTRTVERQPRFQIGDSILTRNIHPLTHTRLPRFARGKPGVITALHGAHVFPDTNALFQGENAHPLYNVRFLARTLWGEVANPRDTVCLDLWEDYLEPA